jgi:hypothetical protein
MNSYLALDKLRLVLTHVFGALWVILGYKVVVSLVSWIFPEEQLKSHLETLDHFVLFGMLLLLAIELLGNAIIGIYKKLIAEAKRKNGNVILVS